MRNDDWMSSQGYFNATNSHLYRGPYHLYPEQAGPTAKRVQVDKTTHRIRYENESESQVTLVIEPKEQD